MAEKMNADEIQKQMDRERDLRDRERFRDNFAAAALTGITANRGCFGPGDIESNGRIMGGTVKQIADNAYQFADQMLEARKV